VRFRMCYACAQGIEVAGELGIERRPEPQSLRASEVSRLRPKATARQGKQKSEKKKAHGGKYSKGEEFPDIARKIREIRTNRVWTQYEFGAFCGLDQCVISKAERGRPISKETAAVIEVAIVRIAHGED